MLNRVLVVVDQWDRVIAAETRVAELRRVGGAGLAREILSAWLAAEYEGGRHQSRIDMMMALEG